MKLFHAATVWQLLNLYCYRKLRTKQSADDWFLLPSFLVSQIPVFCESHNIIEYNQIWRSPIFSTLDVLFEEKGLGLIDFEAIYSGYSQKFFGQYILEKNRKFVFFEDGAGSLLRCDSLMESDESDKNEFVRPVFEKSRDGKFYYAKNAIIEKIVCGFDSYKNINGFPPNEEYGCLVEDFNLQNTLFWLSKDINYFSELKRYFSVIESFNFNKESAIVFTQHLANLRFVTYEGQVNLYRYLRCFFLGKYNQVVWKVHPSDVFNYNLLFPNDLTICERFPAEFLPYISKQFPETISSVWSSSIDNLTQFSDNTLQLSQDFMYSYTDVPYYYSAIVVAKFLDISNVKFYGLDEISFQQLAIVNDLTTTKLHLGASESDNYLVVVNSIDSYESAKSIISEVNENAFVIFLNTNKTYNFYSYEDRQRFNDFRPISVQIDAIFDPLHDHFIESVDHTIYCYTRKEDFMEKLEGFSTAMSFENGGFDLKINYPETEDKLKIALLEGQLAATEARLLEYIKLDKDRNNK